MLIEKFKWRLKMALCDVIKSARLKKGLKQEDAAQLTGVTVQTYSKWENGKTEPKVSQIVKLSEILGVSISEICLGAVAQKLDPMEFMRQESKLSQGVSDFEKTMALWESLDNDYQYLDNLRKYNPRPDI